MNDLTPFSIIFMNPNVHLVVGKTTDVLDDGWKGTCLWWSFTVVQDWGCSRGGWTCIISHVTFDPYMYVHVHRAGGSLVYVSQPCALIRCQVGVKKVGLPLGRFSLNRHHCWGAMGLWHNLRLPALAPQAQAQGFMASFVPPGGMDDVAPPQKKKTWGRGNGMGQNCLQLPPTKL